MKNSLIRHWPKIIISVLLSVMGIIFAPVLVDSSLGKTQHLKSSLIALLVYVGIVVFFLGVLRYTTIDKIYKNYRENLAKSVGRMTLTLIFFGLSVVVMSLLSGLISVVVYALLKKSLTLSQIKGIINFLITLLSLSVGSLMVTVFWEQVRNRKGFFEVIAAAFHKWGKCYIAVLIVLLLFGGLGWLVLTAFHYLPDSVFMTLVKAVVFSVLGAFSLILTDRACR